MNLFSSKKVFLFLLLFFTVTGCKKKETLLFYNKDYYTVFPEKEKNYLIIKKDFLKKFFNVKELSLKNFALLAFEIKKFSTKAPDVLFLENFLITLFLESQENPVIPDLKILTYDLPENIKIESKAAIFNIAFDKNFFNEKTFLLLKKFSREKNLSDILIITDNKNKTSAEFTEFIRKNHTPEIFVITNNEEYNQAKSVINHPDKKAVLFLSNNYNKIILENDIAISKNKIFIEAFTDFGLEGLKSDYIISIEWERLINFSLQRGAYKSFINKPPDLFFEKTKTESNIYTFTPGLKSSIIIKKNNLKKDIKK